MTPIDIRSCPKRNPQGSALPSPNALIWTSIVQTGASISFFPPPTPSLARQTAPGCSECVRLSAAASAASAASAAPASARGAVPLPSCAVLCNKQAPRTLALVQVCVRREPSHQQEGHRPRFVQLGVGVLDPWPCKCGAFFFKKSAVVCWPGTVREWGLLAQPRHGPQPRRLLTTATSFRGTGARNQRCCIADSSTGDQQYEGGTCTSA